MNHRQPNDNHFHELRMRLMDLHRALRHLKDDFEMTKAIAEQRAYADGKVKGSNKEQRDVELKVVVAGDANYIGALANLRDCEYEVERVEQLLEAAKDERRAAEWQIRARLADGLFRQQVQSDSHDPLGDDAFDDVADSRWTDIETGSVYSRDGNYRPSDDLDF